MLENAVCPFKMYGHDASQVSTNKRDLAIFWWDRLLDYKAKSWMVVRYLPEPHSLRLPIERFIAK